FTLLPLIEGEGRRHHGEILEKARELVEAGKLTPLLDPRRFGLEEVGAAYEALLKADGVGKIAVDVASA
ncbi:zinc-binding dehydrogenase, partial [Nostoc sp. NIES-2111]